MKAPDYLVPPRTRSLGHLLMGWINAHCVIPEGDNAGDPFVPTIDHRVWLANWYEVRPTAKIGERNVAFRYRTGQWMAAQKIGKSPGVAAETCAEFVGPALFAGRAEHEQVYLCSDFGCPCGWGTTASQFEEHVFEVGEPLGRPWPTPRIQLAAVVEDQVENTWGALLPMIDDGPLSNVIRKTGEAFIRHPNGNRDSRVEIVTSKADGKLGARISSGKADETGLWTDQNSMKKFMRNLRRGAAGMGGRVSETTNPYNPAEASQAQDTHESKRKDVLKHYYPPPGNLDFSLKKDRTDIFRWNYASSPWVDLRSIEAESQALSEVSPGEAERFFGNRIVAGSGTWFDMTKWALKGFPSTVAPRTKVCGGFDGSENEDHTAIRLETIDGYQFTPTYGAANRKAYWRPSDWNGRIPRAEVMAAWADICEQYDVVRVYWDPQYWESEVDALGTTHGERVFVKWATNRPTQIHAALERFRVDVHNPDSDFTHDEDKDAEAHLRNAIVRSGTVDAITKVRRYTIGKASEVQKIDITMSGVLAHEARMDAIASGIDDTQESLAWL